MWCALRHSVCHPHSHPLRKLDTDLQCVSSRGFSLELMLKLFDASVVSRCQLLAMRLGESQSQSRDQGQDPDQCEGDSGG